MSSNIMGGRDQRELTNWLPELAYNAGALLKLRIRGRRRPRHGSIAILAVGPDWTLRRRYCSCGIRLYEDLCCTHMHR